MTRFLIALTLGLVIFTQANLLWAATFEVPQSRFSLDEKRDLPKDHSIGAHVVFSASSFRPTQELADTTNSRLSNTSPLATQNIPCLSVSYVSSPSEIRRLGTVAFKSGIGLLPMNRTADLPWGGASKSVDQDLFVLPVVLGAEYYPRFSQWKSGSTFVEASLMPTVAILTDSPISDGKVLLGAAGTIGLGASLTLLDQTEFEIAATQSFGALDTLSLTSTSMRAGIRLGL